MRVGRAEEIGVELAMDVDVVRVMALPGEEAVVFLAERASADA